MVNPTQSITLPAYLNFEEVFKASGYRNPETLKRTLRRVRVTRRAGPNEAQVSSEGLARAEPEIYAAVIRMRMARQ
jgi:hypothetical protein